MARSPALQRGQEALRELGDPALAQVAAGPAAGPALMHAVQRLDLYQRDLAGLPVPQAIPAPPVDGVPDELRGAIAAIEVQHTLSKLLERGIDGIPELHKLLEAHPTQPEPAFVLTVHHLEQYIALDLKCRFMSSCIDAALANVAASTGPACYRGFRKLLPLRRRVRRTLSCIHRGFDDCLTLLERIAAQIVDPWQIRLAHLVFAGRRAAVARAVTTRDCDAWTAALHDCIAAIAVLHAKRPEHTEPLLWLTRFHAILGERAEARRFAKLAAHLGERTALAELDPQQC